jgi:type I restriction enzyme S subunit
MSDVKHHGQAADFWSIPDSWGWVSVREIGDVNLGRQRSPDNHFGPHMRPYVRAANISWSGWEFSDVYEMNFDVDDFVRFRLTYGDVLLNEGSGSAREVGKSAIWREEIADCCFQNTLLRVRPKACSSEYLQHYFSLAARSGRFVPNTQGVNIFHIGKDGLAKFPIPLAPLAEQRRIVAKLDALDASAKRARADLDRIPTLVVRAKQAILAREFDQIVEGCDLVPFGEMLEHLTSGSRDWSSYYDRGSCVFVLAGNIRPLYFDPEPKKIIDPPLDSRDAQRSRIQKNDLLLTIVGAGTGDICVVPSDYENYFVCQSVALMRLKDPRLASFFSYWFNGEKHGQGDFARAMYGAARPHLSFDQIREFPVPLVSSPQAYACVRRIEAAFAKIDRIAAEATSARALLDRLDQAILAKAFRGELVPQDPSDEPAEELLEKIKAARAAPPARKTRKKQL